MAMLTAYNAYSVFVVKFVTRVPEPVIYRPRYRQMSRPKPYPKWACSYYACSMAWLPSRQKEIAKIRQLSKSHRSSYHMNL